MPALQAQPALAAEDLNFLRDLRAARHRALTILCSVLNLAQADPADERAAPNRLALLREARLAASQVLAIGYPHAPRGADSRATDRSFERSVPCDATQPATINPTPPHPTPPTKRIAESGALPKESGALQQVLPAPAPPPANPLTRSPSHLSTVRSLLTRAGAPP